NSVVELRRTRRPAVDRLLVAAQRRPHRIARQAGLARELLDRDHHGRSARAAARPTAPRPATLPHRLSVQVTEAAQRPFGRLRRAPEGVSFQPAPTTGAAGVAIFKISP